MKILKSADISELIQKTIADWHAQSQGRPSDYVIVTDEIRRIRPLNEHRDDLEQVVRELVVTNTEMWHEEDKVRSQKDDVVLKAIRNIDEIVLDKVGK